ncbi:alpha/beta-hydrolase [Athelia psychrophila]|uniref:Alpha/beta-hydrolase n=1 Tax=Athelia psychrophila TaxID=1759441 RepID=A0A166S718_9AGAM|nr:alpha/beta-hydrolase [Fibularhizoctonia sp. CBS 109695]
MPSPIPLVYSTVDDLQIKLDVYLPSRIEPNAHLPAIVCFHGGALTIGDRAAGPLIGSWMIDMATANGIAFISADYRLLYPSTAADQLADMRALFSFLARSSDLGLPDGVAIDASRIAVAGVSAGAYLARLAALYAPQRPVAVLSLWGMGGDWFLDHFLAVKDTPPPFKWAHESAPADPEIGAPVAEDPASLDPVSRTWVDKLGRVGLYPLWWARGDFLDHLTGTAGLSAKLRVLPYAERAAAVPEDLRRLFSQLLIDSSFPPTMLVHGDADVTVSVQESERTHAQLEKCGIRSELCVVPNAEHGLRIGADLAPGAERVFEKAFGFVARELGVEV